MRYGFVNNFEQTLAADLAAGATTMTLDGGGALLAGASADYRYKLTLIQTDAYGNETHREIVDVTAASGNDLTVVREQEGTTELAPWPSGTTVQARVTAGNLDNLLPAPEWRPEAIAVGPVDFSNGLSSSSWAAPAGRKFFVDSVDVIPSADGAGGDWAEEAGTPTLAGRGVSLSYNNDRTRVAIGHWSSPGLTVVDTSDWSVVAGTPSLGGSVYGVAYSPDGAYLAVVYSGSSPYLKVFDTSDWSEVAGTPTISGGIYGGVEFSPDGTLLAVGNTYGGGVTVVETAGWTVAQTLTAVNADCTDLRWSPDGSMLAQVHDQPGYKVFETSGWTELQSSTLPAAVYAASFSPDGATLAMGYNGGDNEVHLFNTSDWSDTASTLPFYAGWIACVEWMPSGDQLAVGYDPGGNPDQIAIVNVGTWTLESAIPTADIAWSILPDNDGDLVVGGLAASPYFIAAALTPYAAPTINLGVSAGSPSGLLSGASLETFSTDRRIPVDVGHRQAVSTLYAEPGTASDAGAAATLVVRGYSLEA